MLSPKETRDLLKQLGHQPRKALGQNFLIDANIVRKSIAMSGLQPGEHVVEIGPGLGTLTRALLAAGAKVWAVEADPALYQYQTGVLIPESKGKLHVTLGDAVETPNANIPDNALPYHVIANLPYAISTPWLEHLLRRQLPETITVMVQKEAADRFMASHGSKKFGAVSIFLQAAYQLRQSHKVARTCFHPVPDVDSTIIHLQKRQNAAFFTIESTRLIRQIFTQRRKQIGGILRNLSGDPLASHWLKALTALSINEKDRPEEIPLKKWIELDRVHD